LYNINYLSEEDKYEHFLCIYFMICFFCFCIWNEVKDIFLLREMVSQDIFTHKTGSRERGAVWQHIAKNLNTFEGFNVSPRGVRDRYSNISKKYKVQDNKDRQKTGIGGEELTEFEQLMEEVIGLNDESNTRHIQETNEKKNAISQERDKALETRQLAMERQ